MKEGVAEDTLKVGKEEVQEGLRSLGKWRRCEGGQNEKKGKSGGKEGRKRRR